MNLMPIQRVVRSAALIIVWSLLCPPVTGSLAAGWTGSVPGTRISSTPCDSVASSPFAEGMIIFESSVSIDGGGNTATVLATDSFTVSFDYYLQVCPTSTQNFCQVVVGFSTASPQLCAFRGRVSCDGVLGTLTFRMKAPSFPSQYLIAFDVGRTVAEPPCPTVWPNGAPPPDGYLGCVTVSAGNQPFPATGNADNVTGNSATLHGEVNPSGFATTARFVYGTSPGVYTDSVTAFESPVNGTTALAVSGGITGLSSNTRYHYRATAENVHGYNRGEERSVFTGPQFALAEPDHSFGNLPPGGSKTDSITVLNTGNITLPIISAVSLDGAFSVSPASGSVPPMDSMKFAVTFDPSAYGTTASGIVFTHGGAGSPDTQLVSGGVSIGGVLAGWNIVSVPLTAPDPRKSVLFPEAISSAFGFTTMYVSAETLSNGRGYWLKFPAADSISIPGEPRTADTVSVTAGWNIVGVPSYPVPLDSVTTTPPGIIAGNFFEYDAGYSASTLLRPGKGYWIKISQGGLLTLKGQAGANVPEGVARGPDGSVPLVVTDAGGELRRVFVTARSPAPGMNDIEAPPPPPAGIFDVRFSGGLLATGPCGGVRPVLTIRDAGYPVTVSWSSGIDGTGMVVGERIVSLDVPGEVTVRAGEEVRLVTLSTSGPGTVTRPYGLLGNYPNPFNPSTVITFALAEGGEVGLSVFNVLGESVFRLAEKAMDPGAHEIIFDATGLPAGVYVARMNAGGRVSSVKMLLVK